MRTVLGITGIYTLLALGAVLANPNERVLAEWLWPPFFWLQGTFSWVSAFN